jgi:hypothetical protein
MRKIEEKESEMRCREELDIKNCWDNIFCVKIRGSFPKKRACFLCKKIKFKTRYKKLDILLLLL